MPVFVDSNVLVYAHDPADAAKQSRASAWMSELWISREGRLSIQVLNEFYVTVTGKLRPPVPHERARREVRTLVAWSPSTVDESTISRAWNLQDRFKLSFWDALIVASARLSRCEHLLTEDLQAGRDLGGILVVDPFTTEPGSL